MLLHELVVLKMGFRLPEWLASRHEHKQRKLKSPKSESLVVGVPSGPPYGSCWPRTRDRTRWRVSDKNRLRRDVRRDMFRLRRIGQEEVRPQRKVV